MKRLEITESLRKCTADGRKAIFHRWCDVSQIVPPSPMMGGHGGGVVRDTYAIVEYEDGSIGRIAPERIKFSDNLFENTRSSKSDRSIVWN